MRDPRTAITWYQAQREQPPPSRSNEKYEASEPNRCSNQVKQTRGGLTVFCHIEGPEFCERIVPTFPHQRRFLSKYLQEFRLGYRLDTLKFEILFNMLDATHADQRGSHSGS